MTTTDRPSTRRTRRPMIEMTGTVSDLRVGDYVDEMGGNGYRRMTVGAIVHRVTFVDSSVVTAQVLSAETARSLNELAKGLGIRSGLRYTDGTVTYTNSARVVVEYLAVGRFEFKPEAPVSFRRFAD